MVCSACVFPWIPPVHGGIRLRRKQRLTAAALVVLSLAVTALHPSAYLLHSHITPAPVYKNKHAESGTCRVQLQPVGQGAQAV